MKNTVMFQDLKPPTAMEEARSRPSWPGFNEGPPSWLACRSSTSTSRGRLPSGPTYRWTPTMLTPRQSLRLRIMRIA